MKWLHENNISFIYKTIIPEKSKMQQSKWGIITAGMEFALLYETASWFGS